MSDGHGELPEWAAISHLERENQILRQEVRNLREVEKKYIRLKERLEKHFGLKELDDNPEEGEV